MSDGREAAAGRAPAPPHTAADTELVTTYAGSPETPDTVWPVSGLKLMNLKILKIYTTYGCRKNICKPMSTNALHAIHF